MGSVERRRPILGEVQASVVAQGDPHSDIDEIIPARITARRVGRSLAGVELSA